MPCGTRREILRGVVTTFSDAEHILGSSITELWAGSKKLVFSGDLGANGTPVLRDPETSVQRTWCCRSGAC